MKPLLLLLFMGVVVNLLSLVVIDNKGVSHDYPYDSFFKPIGGEFSTSREKDGVLNTYHWKGIRFDKWLKEQALGDFAKIKFISADKYEASFTKTEWDTLTCWLVYAENNKIFPKEQFRIIFPHLREMYWVRDVQKVVLEDFKKIHLPRFFVPMRYFFSTQTLLTDPEPFTNTKGYSFDKFVPALSTNEIKDIVLYSKDELAQNLSHPQHLAGAMLEKIDPAGYNLKSPQIPGGMWLRDIVYLQCDATALIDTDHISRILDIAKVMNWKFSPDVIVRIHRNEQYEEMSLLDALSEPMMWGGAEYFEIIP